MEPGAIVVLDYEPEHCEYLTEHFRQDGFVVFAAERAAQALELAEQIAPDVIIASDTDLCRRLREGEPGRRWDRNTPVIQLAEPAASPIDRARALEGGADDVVERHVYLELLARTRALIRRAGMGASDTLEARGLSIDRRARQLRCHGKVVRVSGRELDLAVRLASAPTRVFTKAELLKDVWGIRGSEVRTRTLDTHASRLRVKLEAAGVAPAVLNVWGVGYRLFD
ncbi:MAG: response regulator transcription factor [Gaiellales bacterium]